MQKIIPSLFKSVVITSLISSFTFASFAQAGDTQIAPPPTLAVKAYLLKDFNSGNVIATHSAS